MPHGPELWHVAVLSAREAGKASYLAGHMSRGKWEMHIYRQLKVSARTQKVPPPQMIDDRSIDDR